MPLGLESVNHVKVFEDSSEGFAYPVQRVGFERRGLGENRNVNAVYSFYIKCVKHLFSFYALSFI